jgi:hypothetical protein
MKMKSFWSRPEGKTGMIFLAGIGIVTWKFVVPYLITLMANTVVAIGLAVLLAGIFYLLLNKEFRTGMWYLFKMLMRGFTGLIIKIDPIAIMKAYVSNLYKRREDMNNEISRLGGEIIALQRKVSAAKEKEETALKTAEAAKRLGKTTEVTINTREAGRQKGLLEKLEPLLARMIAVKTILLKFYDNTEFAIQDIESEIDVKEIEYNAVKRGTNAMRAAMSIFKGDPDKKAMFDRSIEMVEMNISNKAAEMDKFLRDTQKIVSQIDIEKEMYAEEGLRMLEERGNKSLDIMLLPVGDLRTPEAIKNAGNSDSNSKYGELFS